MKNKLIFLSKNSLSRKIKSKWFIIVNIILAAVIAGIINIDSIIKFFGGDFDEKTKVYVIDDTDYSYDLISSNILEFSKQISGEDKINFEVEKTDKTKKQLEKELKKKEIVIELKEDKKNTLEATILSEGYIATLDYQVLVQSINNTKVAIAMSKSNIDPNLLNSIYEEVNIKREYLDESKKSEDESSEMIMTSVFPVLILPFFILTIILVQTIGAEVNDEKTTRGMEIIISNVSPKTHFFSKIIAGNIFVIGQGLLLILYGAIGFFIRKVVIHPSSSGLEKEIGNIVSSVAGTDFVDKLIYLIPIVLVLMVITLVAYSLLAGILASMTTNAEDFQQLQTPIVIVSLVGYYLAMMAGMFKGALFIKILSYVPFISAILSPSLLVLGQIGIIDIMISILISFITVALLIRYGLRIYKVGILNYSSKDLWKKMFKAIKD